MAPPRLEVTAEQLHKWGYSREAYNSLSKYRRHYLRNQEKRTKLGRDLYAANPEPRREYASQYQTNNREARQTYNAAYYKDNKEWLNRPTALTRYHTAKRRAHKKSATPTWLTKEQVAEMKSIYNLARECEILTGDKYHVDHIIPLQGNDICGLHVPWNLQVLPADLNIRKGNRYE